jgi:erythromycin esterase
MQMPPAKPGSYEDLLFKEKKGDRVILPAGDKKRKEILPHRAIGVVYDPANESMNYVPSNVEERYDAFVFLERTRALHPIEIHSATDKIPETYPFEF